MTGSRARALAFAVVVAASTAAVHADTGVCVPVPAVDDRCEEWVARVGGAPGETSSFYATAVSPTAPVVFATGLVGTGSSIATSSDVLTAAFDQRSGEELWRARFDNGNGKGELARAIAVHPAGTYVYAVGQSDNAMFGATNLLVLAYRAEDGALAWKKRWDGVVSGPDEGWAVAVDRGAVYVAARTGSPSAMASTAVLALDPETGSERWIAHHAPRGGLESVTGLLLDPSETVYVVGVSVPKNEDANYLVVALDAEHGTVRWETSHDTSVAPGDWVNDIALAGALASDGGAVFVTGATHEGARTLRLDAATGAVEWTATFAGTDPAYGLTVAVDPSGDTVYAGGGNLHYTNPVGDVPVWVAAYDARDGSERWSGTYGLLPVTSGPLMELATALHVSGSGTLLVHGSSAGQMIAFGLDPATGARRWSARYLEAGSRGNGFGAAPSVDGTATFAVGTVSSVPSASAPAPQPEAVILAYAAE